MAIVDQNKLGDKLTENKFRFFFRYIPNNFVLQQENIFTGRPIVKGPGIRFLFGFSQARQIKPETVDFNMQRIDAYGNQDVMVDLAVTFEIDGGLRSDDETSIKSENKINRRAWAINHGLHKFIKDEIAIREDIQRLKGQGNHKDTDSKTGILESAVKDVIRKYLTGKKFDDIKKLDEKTYFPESNAEGNDEKTLKSEIEEEINRRFKEHGLRVVSVDFKNIKQSEEVNELEEKRKIAEKNIEISKLQAQAYAEKRVGEAKADAEAIELRGKAEAKNKQAIIDAAVKAYGDKNVDEINAINGNKVTYNKVDLGGIVPNVSGVLSNLGTASIDEIGGGSNPSIKREIISDPIAEVMGASELSNDSDVPNIDENLESIIQEDNVDEQEEEKITSSDNSITVPEKNDELSENKLSSDEDIVKEIKSNVMEINAQAIDEKNDNEDVSDIETAVTEEDYDEKSDNLETELFDDNDSSLEIESDNSETELFDEQPTLSDSQITELSYSDDEKDNQPYSYKFFSGLEDTPVVEEESKTSEDIDILKSMKSELTAAIDKSNESESIIQENPAFTEEADKFESTLPEIEIPKIEEEPKVEEKPKGLNLDFINSTWGRK